MKPRKPSTPRGIAPVTVTPLPLRGWSLDFARRWNSGAYAVFVLHGNIFDVHPLREGDRIEHVPLKRYLSRRFFPDRSILLYYDITDGLTFGSTDMQARFFKWLEVFDQVERTNYHRQGPPVEFIKLVPLLRRFFLAMQQDATSDHGVTLIVDFPEKIIPAAEETQAGHDERRALVALLKWAASSELRRLDVGVILVTETANELHADLLQNPHVAQVRIDLPDQDDRLQFVQSGWLDAAHSGKDALPPVQLASRTAGLNLVRIQQLVSEAIRNSQPLSASHVAASKKRLIEDYCHGLVRFKEPKPGRTLDLVATHDAAKQKLRDLAWLIREGKTNVLERGVLLPGRVGVGKSFLIDCFASECGLPVMELGEFRSKWVGETERQQARILMTIRALGPVIVVVDEADAVFGNRQADGDSGVSSRVFAAFAAHLGDASLRGRELWVAMTSRPDLLAIDMKRQGRFGLCIPIFPAQSADDVVALFKVIAKSHQVALSEDILAYIRDKLGNRPLTGSDIESMVVRAKERAVLAKRDDDVQLTDLQEAVDAFIDPLDPNLLALQELAAVLACSDRRYLAGRYRDADRTQLLEAYQHAKRVIHQ
jgi:AAA+ superfamily predicted ATPase